jgi:hypothetical protein
MADRQEPGAGRWRGNGAHQGAHHDRRDGGDHQGLLPGSEVHLGDRHDGDHSGEQDLAEQHPRRKGAASEDPPPQPCPRRAER